MKILKRDRRWNVFIAAIQSKKFSRDAFSNFGYYKRLYQRVTEDANIRVSFFPWLNFFNFIMLLKVSIPWINLYFAHDDLLSFLIESFKARSGIFVPIKPGLIILIRSLNRYNFHVFFVLFFSCLETICIPLTTFLAFWFHVKESSKDTIVKIKTRNILYLKL